MKSFKSLGRILGILSLSMIAACSKPDSPKTTELPSNGQGTDGGPQTTTTTTLPTPSPTPVPTPIPTPQPTPAPTPTPSETAFDIFTDVATPVGQRVDDYYSSYRELLVQRSSSSSSTHHTDSCDPNLDQKFTFADRIAYYVNKNMELRKAQLSFIGDLFGMPTTQSAILDTSIVSNAMCPVTSATLAITMGSSRVPSASVITKANSFVTRFNTDRSKMLQGDVQAKVDLTKLVSRLMMCLSYVESLTSADTSSSERVASQYAPSGYRRPAGVDFYEDAGQPIESRLNIGLFQFTPTAGGNIYPCIKTWNEIYPSCQIATNSSQAEMIRITGSSYQSFNAFCGSNKVAQMFSVQLNTTKAKNTHPANVNSDGSLKSAQNRCVTLHFAGASYNHFGPFQNSTGSNMNELLTCALAQ